MSGLRVSTSKFKMTDLFSKSAFEVQFKDHHFRVTVEYSVLVIVLLLFFLYLLVIILFLVLGSKVGVVLLLIPLLALTLIVVFAVVNKLVPKTY